MTENPMWEEPDEGAEKAAREALQARRLAFLADLNELCAKHRLHIDAWATYADDSFFGIAEGPTTYTLEQFSWKENEGEIEHR